MRQYEAMFLFDSTFAGEFANVEKEVERIMERAGAEIILARKWEERRLAYEIKGHKRGCYVLVYFRAPPDRIGGIERDCRIAEHVLRVLILSAEDISREKMEQTATCVPSTSRTARSFHRESGGAKPREVHGELNKNGVEGGTIKGHDTEGMDRHDESKTVDAVAQSDDNEPTS